MAKEQKTAEELKALLDEQIAPYQLGGEANPRWVKIIPADPDKEGANWKLSHSSQTVPTGDLADAVNRVTPELQKLYDLKEEWTTTATDVVAIAEQLSDMETITVPYTTQIRFAQLADQIPFDGRMCQP